MHEKLKANPHYVIIVNDLFDLETCNVFTFTSLSPYPTQWLIMTLFDP